jgi:hypothetical protein
MEDLGITHSVGLENHVAGRRHAIRAAGAIGMALLTSLGLQGQTSAKSKNKRRVKRGSAGHPGPSGPQGPVGATGATGATGPDYVPVGKSGPQSIGLAVATGSAVDSIVTCGKGKVLSCGYNVGATAAQMVNVIVKGVAADQDLSICQAMLERTTNVGSTAGATIIAYAICKP